VRQVLPSVSARHVEVYFYAGAFYVRNLKLANPVAVNGRTIEHSTRLTERDEITFGGMTFVVRDITNQQQGVRCHNCKNVIDVSYIDKDCPMCGHAMVNSTILS
jgi:rubrerythrin